MWRSSGVKVFFGRFYSSDSHVTKTVDVAIIGGNLVGTSFACALGTSPVFKNKKIALIESRSIRIHEKHLWSNRSYAITTASRQFLQSIGAWKLLTTDEIYPARQMKVWESHSNAAMRFDAGSSIDPIFDVVDQHSLLRVLHKRLETLPNVEYLSSCRITETKLPSTMRAPTVQPPPLVYLDTLDGERISAELLIAADGFNSQIRKLMGVNNIAWSYHQKAVVAVVSLSVSHGDCAYQRFINEGVAALLPLSDNKACLIWTVDDQYAEKVLSMNDEDFIDQLNGDFQSPPVSPAGISGLSIFAEQQVRPPIVEHIVPGTRGSYPLGMGHATTYVAPRVALMGDAAHRIHPLAGQGVNFGFGDAACLTRILEDSVCRGDFLGNIDPLLQYESSRQRSLLPFQIALEGILRLYQANISPIIFMRTLGVQILNSSSLLKRAIMNYASH